MVEGGGSKDFQRIKRMMYESPETLHRLLEVLARATTLYLNAQIAAGAQAVMLFDTWGGVLTPAQYREFSLAYMARIVASLTREAEGRRVPSIVFTKGGGAWLARDRRDRMRCSGRRLDHGLGQPHAARCKTASPCRAIWIRLRCSRRWTRCVRRHVGVLESFGKGPGHVFNLGHGITPGVDPDRVGVWSRQCAITSPERPADRAPPDRAPPDPAAAQFVAQRAPQDLADVGLRQLGAEVHVLGHLVSRQVRRGQYSIKASAVRLGSFFTTNRATDSPELSSGCATAATSSTPGCSATTLSISFG